MTFNVKAHTAFSESTFSFCLSISWKSPWLAPPLSPSLPPSSEDVEVVAALGLGVVAQHLVEDAAHAHSRRLPARDGAAAHGHQPAPRRLLPVELQGDSFHVSVRGAPAGFARKCTVLYAGSKRRFVDQVVRLLGITK